MHSELSWDMRKEQGERRERREDYVREEHIFYNCLYFPLSLFLSLSLPFRGAVNADVSSGTCGARTDNVYLLPGLSLNVLSAAYCCLLSNRHSIFIYFLLRFFRLGFGFWLFLFACLFFVLFALLLFSSTFLFFHLPSMQLYWINIFFRFSCNYKSLIEFSRLVVFVSFFSFF